MKGDYIMKKMLLYCILLFSSYSVYGQNIKYSYDLAGNCISRKMETVQKYSDSKTLDNENNINNEIQIRVYPTPVKDMLNVSVNALQREEDTGRTEYTLYNLSGQVLQKGYIDGGSVGINMSDYPNSVYVLRVVCGGENKVYKVVKQ